MLCCMEMYFLHWIFSVLYENEKNWILGCDKNTCKIPLWETLDALTGAFPFCFHF